MINISLSLRLPVYALYVEYQANIMKINAFKKRRLCIKSLNNCNQVYANDSDYVFSASRQTNKIV